MKLILSTSNILGARPSIRPSTHSKSNAEFIASLRANFDACSIPPTPDYPNGNGNEDRNGTSNGAVTPIRATKAPYTTWTKQQYNTLEVPALDFTASALQEERAQYDITLKLFYLPSASTADREQQTREALSLVLKELHMPSVDLLILSFPGIYFDEEEDCPDKLSTRGPVEADPERIDTQIDAWAAAEKLVDDGLVKKLGIAEFGHDRLQSFLDGTRIPPSVDQINLRDCCSVPKDLLTLAKTRGVELLVHNDCSNVLPRGTLRELLGTGEHGAGLFAEPMKTGDKRKSLHGEDGSAKGGQGLKGEVKPLWVVKYTAVVRDRGVVENKGYFAGASVEE